jgi:hypothetical protein
MKKLLFLICILYPIITVNGQYVEDALRYSQDFPAITARSLSMGGAFTSLGGDFSSVLLNPAGLGLYRKSEFEFTPMLDYTNTNSTYYGTKSSDYRYQFNLGSLGYVGTYNSSREKGLVSASLALGFVRQNNFNRNVYIRGTNPNNSLTDYFMNNAQGVNPENLDPFYERLAFDAYIIDTVPGTQYDYQTPVLLPIDQRKTIHEKGGDGEWAFATGLNFSNVFYVGLGLNIHQLHYDRTAVHSEFDTDQNNFDRFFFTEDLHVDGTGFSMNFGAMARLLKIMRIGASLQLPTYYRMHENYYNTMYSQFDDGFSTNVYPTDANGNQLPEGQFRYKLNTPLKAQGGISVQLGQAGMIAADVEYVDYASMRLRENDTYTDFSTDNGDIQNVYKSVLNIKLGGEARFDNFSVRLGGGYYPSPVSSSISSPAIFDYIGTVPDSRTELTTGFGYRNEHFFFDLGYSHISHSEKYNLYFDNTASLKQGQNRFLATMGFRF